MKLLKFVLCLCVACFMSQTWAQNSKISSKEVQKVISSGNVGELQKLIDNGLDVDKRLSNGETPLIYALSVSPDFAMANLLIEAGADTNLAARNGMTPLILAAGAVPTLQASGKIEDPQTSRLVQFQLKHAKEMIEILLEADADINQDTPFGTPLMKACSGDWNLEIVEFLLENGADVNQINFLGRTALFYANAYKAHDVEILLLKNGANINIRDIHGKHYTDVSVEDLEN